MSRRAPQLAIDRLKDILAHAEGLADAEDGYSETAGRRICGVAPEHREGARIYVESWIREPLAEILEYLEGGKRPWWWDDAPNPAREARQRARAR